MDPPTSPPAIISFIDGRVHNNNIHRTRRLSRSSHPSEPEPVSEPESVQHDLLLEEGIQKHQHQQPLQCNLHDDNDNDDDDNNNEHNVLLEPQFSQHHQHHLQTNHNIVNNEELSQMIAQKMLTTKTTTATSSSPASTSTNRNNVMFHEEENAQDIKFHSIPQKYHPVPWEQEPPPETFLLDYDSHPNGQVDDRHHHYHQIAPPSPSYYLPRNNIMQEPSPTATNDDDDADDDNNTITSSSRTVPTTTTTTTTTKSVTFRTHDEVHQFDEQLEVLKYVDEEFFLVAHYLLEVVDFEDDHVDNDQYYHHNAVLFGNEADGENINSKSCTSCFGVGGDDVPKKRDIRRGGAGLLSRLLFGCGLVLGDDDSGIQGILRNNDFKDQKGSSWRGYQLSTKLVSNFVSALNFRMENIQAKLDDGEELEDEDDLVVKTREVARKINTYGLPMMIPPPSSCEGVTTMTAKKKIGSHTTNNVGNSRHFPILPIHKDDNDVDEYDTFGVDENDGNLYNRSPPPPVHVVGVARHESSPTLWSNSSSAPPLSSRKNLSSLNPTANIIIHNNFSPRALISSSLFQPKSTNNTPTTTTTTTSEAACKKRLARISHEIHKVTSMMHHTQNQSVRHACSRRISKLRYERRLYQIIQERYNIQCMMATTRVESVRVACSERMKQLVLELEYLKHTEQKKEEEEDRDDDGGGAEYEERRRGELLSQSYPTHNNYVSDDTREEAAAAAVIVDEEEQDNNRWYDRVLKYVHGLTDEGGVGVQHHGDEKVDMNYFAPRQPHHPTTTLMTTSMQYDERYPPVAYATTRTHCGSLDTFIL